MKKNLALAALLLSMSWAVSAAQTSSTSPQVLPENSHGGAGLAEGVAESTDPDRIAAIEERARQLESTKFDSYEAPAAGKRHNKPAAKRPHAGAKPDKAKPAVVVPPNSAILQ